MTGAFISASSLLSIPNAYLVILPDIMIFPGSGIQKQVSDQSEESKTIVCGISNLLIDTSRERFSKIFIFCFTKIK